MGRRELGLDRDDIVVKRRVRQKIEMIAERSSTRAPTDADLSAYLTANQARFVQPAILTFEQVFLGHPRPARVVHAVAVTREDFEAVDPEKLGKPTLLPYRMTLTPADLVARDFGASFAAALEKVPVGEGADRLELGRTTCASRIARPRWRRNSPPCATRSCANGRTNAASARATTPTRRCAANIRSASRRSWRRNGDENSLSPARRRGIALPRWFQLARTSSSRPTCSSRSWTRRPTTFSGRPRDRRATTLKVKPVPRRDRGTHGGAQHLLARCDGAALAHPVPHGLDGQAVVFRSSRRPGSTCSRGSCAWTAACSSNASCP